MNAAESVFSFDVRQFRNRWTVSAVVPMVVFLLAIVADHQVYTVYRFDGAVHSDGEGYYAYLPSYLVYFDPTLKTFINTQIIPAYAGLGHLGPQVFGFSLQPTGNWLDKYGIGVALLLLPFFLVGHAIGVATTPSAQGYSAPELLAVALAALVYMTAGLYALRALLLRWFPDWAVVVTLVSVTFGGGLFETTIWDPSLSHTYSFFAVAMLLWLALRWYDRPRSWWRIVFLGAMAGLIVDIRLTNAVLLVIVPLLGVGSLTAARQRAVLLWRRRLQVVAGGATAIVTFAPQSLVWHLATGHWLVRSYPGEPFDFLHPHLLDSLISFQPHGLLPYAPVLLFSLAGLAIAWVRRRDLAIPVTVALLLFWYLVASWWDWSFTGGFGNRAFVDALPLFAVTMALCFASVRQRVLRASAVALAAAFMGVTCAMMLAYWQGRIPLQGIDVSGYFSILQHPHRLVGPLSINPPPRPAHR